MANKRFPTDTPLKSTPSTGDFLLVADSLDSQVSKRVTIQSVSTLITSGLNLSSKADKTNVLQLDNTTSYTPTTSYHPTTKTYVDTLLSAKADKVNVLQLDNTTAYLPSSDYHPVPKVYADTISSSLSAHEADVSNPHSVTLSQVSSGGGGGAVISDIELKDYSETLSTPSSSGGVLNLDYSEGNVFEVTLTEDITAVNITNPPATGRAASVTLKVIQDPATPRTVSWGSIKWNNGSSPTVTATIDAIDFFTFTSFDGGATWYGFTSGQAMA